MRRSGNALFPASPLIACVTVTSNPDIDEVIRPIGTYTRSRLSGVAEAGAPSRSEYGISALPEHVSSNDEYKASKDSGQMARSRKPFRCPSAEETSCKTASDEDQR